MLAILSSVIRFPGLVLLGFFAVYGAASRGPGVPAYERVEGPVVAGLVVATLVATALLVAQFVAAVTHHRSWLVRVAATIAIVDAAAVGFLLWQLRNGAPPVLAVGALAALAIQLGLVAGVGRG